MTQLPQRGDNVGLANPKKSVFRAAQLMSVARLLLRSKATTVPSSAARPELGSCVIATRLGRRRGLPTMKALT